jgi:minor extracellular protease Epr
VIQFRAYALLLLVAALAPCAAFAQLPPDHAFELSPRVAPPSVNAVQPTQPASRDAVLSAGGGNWSSSDPDDLAHGSFVDGAEAANLPNQILGLNIGPEGLRAARDLGFGTPRMNALETTGLTLVRLRVPPGLSAAEALAALRQRDPAGFYDVNSVYRLAESGASRKGTCRDVRCYPQALIAWGAACGVDARVGLLDSAVNRMHPALRAARIRSLRLDPGSPTPYETEHGTALAVLLVGARGSAFAGLLPEAELVTADVFVDGGGGHLYTDAARMSAGIDWIAGENPAAINVSVTGADNAVLHTVIHRVARLGIPIVAAVGNDGPAAPPAYPAAYEEVIAVTAVDGKLEIYPRANHGSYVALAAPGVDVWTTASTGDNGVLRDGTSFAAPFVTAAIARLKVAEPRSKPADLSQSLRKTARHLGPPGDNPVFGSGLLQVGSCAGWKSAAPAVTERTRLRDLNH